MNNIAHYGLAEPMHRSSSGALLSCELEEICDFLRRDGLLIAEYANCFIIITHPRLFERIKEPMRDAGLQPLLLGATLPSIRQATDLTLAENRVMELLSPGTLILVRNRKSSPNQFPLFVPDNRDLQTIATVFNGTMLVYLWKDQGNQAQIEGVLQKLEKACQNYMIGILEEPMAETEKKRITVARINSFSDIECITEGTINLFTIKEAANRVSIWEIEDWT